MTRRLTLRKETIAALTTDEMSSVVGGGAASFHCTMTLLPVAINQPVVLCVVGSLLGICRT